MLLAQRNIFPPRFSSRPETAIVLGTEIWLFVPKVVSSIVGNEWRWARLWRSWVSVGWELVDSGVTY